MRKSIFFILSLLLCVITSSCFLDEDDSASSSTESIDPIDLIVLLTNNMTEAELYQIAGKPKGTFTIESRKILIYEAAQIPTENGVVVDLPLNFATLYKTQLEALAQGKQQKELGFFESWLQKLQPSQWFQKVKNKITRRAYVLKDRNGKPIDHSALISPGKVTVVDFYADWCGPCRTMAPHLEALMKKYPDAVLKKVDIIDWNSEISKQYGVNVVPNVRVFDRYGNLIAKPTSTLSSIERNIRKAMKR